MAIECPICNGTATTCQGGKFDGRFFHIPAMLTIYRDWMDEKAGTVQFNFWPLSILNGMDADRLHVTRSGKESSTVVLMPPADGFQLLECSETKALQIQAHYPSAVFRWAGQTHHVGMIADTCQDLHTYFVRKDGHVQELFIDTQGLSFEDWAYENNDEFMAICRAAGMDLVNDSAIVVTNGRIESTDDIKTADVRVLWAVNAAGYLIYI